MGGMAAQIPIKNDNEANIAALNKVETDKVKSDIDFIGTELTKLSDRLNEIELIVKKQANNSINILCDFILSQAKINN